MESLQLSVPCVVNPRLRGRIAEETRRRVNWEVFYLSNPGTAKVFDRDPRKYCEVLTDPVTKRRFAPGTDARKLEHAGRLWYFPSDSSYVVFAATPDSFMVPDLSMVPKTN